jgi:hypothetical protein
MELPPGLVAARRLIAAICAVLAVLAVGGAIAYSLGDVGNGCGSGWEAARKPLPSPLLSPAEIDAIQKAKRNPYEAGIEKARPIRACRSAGSSRLIRSGLGAALVLLPVGAILALLYWPKRSEGPSPDEVIDISDGTPSAPLGERVGWGDRSRTKPPSP